METLRLFVIRHGETASTREHRYTGWQDVPLAERGAAQAEAVARALASQTIGAVYSSPLERCRTSAEIIAKPHRLDVRIDPGFRELSFGAWEGLTGGEVAARFPDELRTWRRAPHTVAPGGGELVTAVAERVSASLQTLRETHGGSTVVLVAHSIVIRLIVLGALGLGPDRLWTVDASPGGITELEFTRGSATVHRMNTQAHLAALP